MERIDEEEKEQYHKEFEILKDYFINEKRGNLKTEIDHLFFSSLSFGILFFQIPIKKFILKKKKEEYLRWVRKYESNACEINLSLLPENNEVRVIGILKNSLLFLHFFISKGAGLYTLVSFFNHSCKPNVERLNYGNSKAIMYTLTKIEEGEELTFSYFDLKLFDSFNFEERSSYIEQARGSFFF